MPRAMQTAAEVFGPDGLLAAKFPGYEPRPGQARMAEAVARALAGRTHLAVEAPCGVGKSFAYLVPAIAHAVATESRVVVCTANIALQEQLVTQDLPRLRELLPEPFAFRLIKGIGNYLCLDRWEESREDPGLFAGDDQRRAIDDWARSTGTGDVSELPFVPADAVWGRVNGVSELCNGAQCRHFEPCFAMDARRRLLKAQIIVTNYHLYFAHLAVKVASGRDVILPPHSAVVGDEAHELTDVARDFFGRKLSPWTFVLIARGAERLGLNRTAEAVRLEARAFFDETRRYHDSGRYRIRLREGGFADGGGIAKALETLSADLKAAGESARNETDADRAGKYLGAATRAAGALQAFLALDDPGEVSWIEPDTSRAGDASSRLCARRIEVRDVLKEHLFGAVPSVILTSATLTSGGSFEFLKRETGADGAAELVVGSPFDYAAQARLVVPDVGAQPGDAGFAPAIAQAINEILRRLGGRTLALFTSYKNLNVCAEAARDTGVEILRQGDRPRSKLLEAFRQDRGTALFATTSFWQGVDVPGPALSCLVIDKLPFTTPEDPLIDALQERDPETFERYQLPRTILALRQGFGRLIRRRDDRGVCVIFDRRLFTRRYGSTILGSLPPASVHRSLEAAFEFLGV